ncbi:hypothetical protein [Shimia biformata]|uniref:hypothetical protein n=1 Tax=Shimia biformata TaxID=1294299 RepID=UPI00194E118F|nr:hypothetical protein [Shimia biformata]
MTDLDGIEDVLRARLDMATARLRDIQTQEFRYRSLLQELSTHEKTAAIEAMQMSGYNEAGHALVWAQWVQARRNCLNAELATIMAQKLSQMTATAQAFGRLEAVEQLRRAEHDKYETARDLARSEALLGFAALRVSRDYVS